MPVYLQSAAAVASGVAIKLCRRCNHQKPVSEFYRSKANADGYDGRCKVLHLGCGFQVLPNRNSYGALEACPRCCRSMSSGGLCVCSTCLCMHARISPVHSRLWG